MSQVRLILARYAATRSAVVYGGAEPDGEALARAYRYWRKLGKQAAEAVRLAVADTLGGRSRWPSDGVAAFGAAMKDGGRWIENALAGGLRFVGFADDIARQHGSGRDRFGGWFTDDSCDETLRACVYQLAAKNGRPRYVPAYREGSASRDKGWRDTSTGRDSDSAVVYLNAVELGEPGGEPDGQALISACHYADGRAERHAEERREYAEAWQAGNRCAALREEAADSRLAFLTLRRQIKAEPIRPQGAAICAALRSKLAEFVSDWKRAKAKAAELERNWTQGWRGELAAAFREGADV